MAVYGSLQTMALPDLLQWASLAQKSGVLQVERNQITRAIEFQKGLIRACVSDDPTSRVGQFLLARGKISEDQLTEALARQEQTQQTLGVILVEMEAITRRELSKHIADKAEETILALFDWGDASFRFDEGATIHSFPIEVDLTVEDVLLRGIQHQDELKQIRKVFTSSGVVLRRTARPAPQSLTSKAIASRIYESIDGQRTLAEILLRARASEFLVLKLLYQLHKGGLLEIHGERPSATSTLLDPPSELTAELPDWMPRDPGPTRIDLPDRTPVPTGGAGAAPDDAETEVEVALRLLSRGEHAVALDLLHATSRARPDDTFVTQLIARAEAAQIRALGSSELAHDKVPIVVVSEEERAGREIDGDESFLLGLMDGKTDIKSILWLSPLREVDVLRTIQRMVESGLIEIRDKSEAAAGQSPVQARVETS